MRFVWIFVAEFFFSLHFAATLYINSSFLGHFFPLGYIGGFFVLGAILSVGLFFLAPRLLNRWGNRRFLVTFLTLTLSATLGAAFTKGPADALFFFLLYAAVSPMVFYALDILVEELTTNRKTGQIRGLYLTVMNAAIILGPLLITLTSVEEMFKNFYLGAAVVLLPIFVLATFSLKSKFKNRKHTPHSLPLKQWWRKKSVRHITLARLILEFFYALMTIYTPIYLHQIIGFSWVEIGQIFAIMLLPFIIFEWPVGALADKKTGEKEILSLGFGVMLVALIFMPLLDHNFTHWTVILFVSRMGASFIEITTESYFFKQIDSGDTGLISIFRLARSVGLILGAGVGALAVYIWPLSSIFIILAVSAFLGQRFSKRLVDTK